MKLASRFCTLLIATVLAASTVLAAPVLKNGDRWPVSSPRAVAVDTANHLFFMARGNVLTILNAALAAQGQIDLGAEIRCISYADGYVFAALGSDGLASVNVSTSAVNTFNPADGSSVASVFVSGNYAYITNIGNRFKVLNVTNPAAPTEIGAENLSGLLVSAVNVHVSGNVAAVVDQVNGLHLLNVADKNNPQWESVTAIAGAYDARLDGSYAYVASIAGGLDIVDYGDTGSVGNPQMLGGYTPVDGYSVGVFVDGNDAWLADQVNGLHVINVTDRDNPTLSSTHAGTIGACSVAVDGANVYVADTTQGLQLIGGGSYDLPGKAQAIFVDSDDYLYVVSDTAGGTAADEGLRILDAYNPGNIGYKGFVETPGQAHGVFVDGNYAFVADGAFGLQIIDASDKSNPVISGTRDTAGSAQAVFVSGNYAFIADLASGLQVIDVIDKTAPGNSVDANEDTPGAAYGVFVAGSYAYVADGTSGLQIFDVSVPAAPSIVGDCDTPGSARDVYVSGSVAYVADDTSGVQVINVSDKTNPQIIGSYDTGSANGIFVNASVAKVADAENGLVTLDVSDPTNPSKINAWSTGTTAEALGVHVAGEYVYVAEGLGGAAVYQLTDEEPFVPTPPPDSDSGGGCFLTSLGF